MFSFCFFKRDLKKAELHLSFERAKVDSRLQNMDFLKAKSEEFRLGIKAAEVCPWARMCRPCFSGSFPTSLFTARLRQSLLFTKERGSGEDG